MSNGCMADLAGEVLKQATEMVNTESLVLRKVYKDRDVEVLLRPQARSRATGRDVYHRVPDVHYY